MSRSKVESIGVAAERGRTENEARQRAAQEANDNDDVLSLRLFHLSKIAHLAAFAAESRRVLEGIEDATRFRPEIREAISAGVSDSEYWTDLEDTSGEVLSNLAHELEKINIDLTDTVYGLALVSKGGTGEERKE